MADTEGARLIAVNHLGEVVGEETARPDGIFSLDFICVVIDAVKVAIEQGDTYHGLTVVVGVRSSDVP